jgi:hypothetical protein
MLLNWNHPLSSTDYNASMMIMPNSWVSISLWTWMHRNNIHSGLLPLQIKAILVYRYCTMSTFSSSCINQFDSFQVVGNHNISTNWWNIPVNSSWVSSSLPSTKPPCDIRPPKSMGRWTRRHCKSTPISSSPKNDSWLPWATNHSITNWWGRLGIGAPAIIEVQGGGGIDKGNPLALLEQRSGFAMVTV